MEVPGRRLLFLVFYTTVVTGIFFSTIYTLFSIYTGNPINSVSWIYATSFYRGSTSKPQTVLGKAIWHPPPAGTPFPSLESFKLSKDLKNVAKDDTIIVKVKDFRFISFSVALDKKVVEALYWKGIPVFDMGSNFMLNDVGWGSAGFGKIGREKVLLLNTLLPFGYKVLLCDTDTVWLKNPMPYFAQFPEADVLTSNDQMASTDR